MKYSALLEYMEILRNAGSSQELAEAHAKGLQIVRDDLESHLATKHDIELVRHDTELIRKDIEEMSNRHNRDMKEMANKHSQDMKEMDNRHSRDMKEMAGKHSHDMNEMDMTFKHKIELVRKDIKTLELQIKDSQKGETLKIILSMTGVMAGLLAIFGFVVNMFKAVL